MKKKLALLLCMALTVALFAGCTSKEESQPDNTPKTQNEGTEVPAEPAGEGADAQTPAVPADSDGYVVGLSSGNIGNTWCAQFIEDFETAAKAYQEEGMIKDYQVTSSNSDVTQQVNQCISMLNSGVDALLIWPVSPTALKPVIDKAKEKGVLVVITNDAAAYEDTVAVLGNNLSWERLQAVWLAEQLQGKGDIVHITGVPGNSGDTLRQEVANEVFSQYPDINILGTAPGKWSQTEAQSVMTTFLSTYKEIDAVFAQDIMAEGILKAYENAGKEPPVMTGDSVKSFFEKWNEMPDLNSIGVAYAPGVVVTALDVAVNLLSGKELNPDKLVANPLDESLINTIYVDPIYVVTKEGDQNAKWMEGLNGSKAISLDETLEMMADKSETTCLDGWISREEVLEYFQ